MLEDGRSKIINKERIGRLIDRMCVEKLLAIIRRKTESSVAIRSCVQEILSEDVKYIRLDKISKKGMTFLHESDSISVEVIGMPTRLIFQTKIVKRQTSSIMISFPTSLLSIERRTNSRYRSTVNCRSYVALNDWRAIPDDIAAPPTFEIYDHLSSWCFVHDLSSNGLCLSSYFPSVIKHLRIKGHEKNAKIIFPMQDPLLVNFTIRWCRKIQLKKMEHDFFEFRIGGQFFDLNPSTEKIIAGHIKKLSLMDII